MRIADGGRQANKSGGGSEITIYLLPVGRLVVSERPCVAAHAPVRRPRQAPLAAAAAASGTRVPAPLRHVLRQRSTARVVAGVAALVTVVAVAAVVAAEHNDER